MPTVLLPRSWSNDDTSIPRRLEMAEGRVADVIATLLAAHPALAPWLDNGRGRLPEYTHVTVGSDDVRILDGLETRVGPDDTVRFISELTGG